MMSGTHMTRRFLRSRASGVRRRHSAVSTINITPMVDVMLVLLIIFMITAPLLTTGVAVELPDAQAPSLHEPIEPVVLSVDADGRLFVQEQEISLKNLQQVLRTMTVNRPDAHIYLRGDRELEYRYIIEVMSQTAQAGFTRISLLTDSSSKQR